MMTAGEYWELGSHYELSAERASDRAARHQLQTLAESYFALARSMSVLERSARLLDWINER